MRWAEAALLVLLSATAAGPLSTWFARVRWTAREPVAALVAWQAIGLSGGLALLTAELTLAAADRRGPWRDGVGTALAHPGSAHTVQLIGLVMFGLSLAWLGGVLVGSFAGAMRARRAHRTLLELLSTPVASPPQPGFDVIETNSPVAYSLPGRTPHVVLSTAAVSKLGDSELAAVLAHERAHLRQRHSILVQPFIAWQHSLPFLRAPLAARRRVEQLAEMVCDDAACRSCAPIALAAALATLDPSGAHTVERIERLAGAGSRLPLRAALLCGAVILVCVPPAVLLTIPA